MKMGESCLYSYRAIYKKKMFFLDKFSLVYYIGTVNGLKYTYQVMYTLCSGQLNGPPGYHLFVSVNLLH